MKQLLPYISRSKLIDYTISLGEIKMEKYAVTFSDSALKIRL